MSDRTHSGGWLPEHGTSRDAHSRPQGLWGLASALGTLTLQLASRPVI